MYRLSRLSKVNNMLNGIAEQLLDISDSKKESIVELKRYRTSFNRILGYNIYDYGSILVYYYDIRCFYKKYDYTSMDHMSNDEIVTIYKRHIQYCTNWILKNRVEV